MLLVDLVGVVCWCGVKGVEGLGKVDLVLCVVDWCVVGGFGWCGVLV